MTDKVIYQTDKPQTVPKTSPAEEYKLEVLSEAETEPLLVVKTVFPFDLFPDRFIIYRQKISLIRKNFFFDADDFSIPIENISSVNVHISFPFSSLHITERFFADTPLIVDTLWTRDARKAMQVLDGLRIAIAQHVDVMRIPKPELLTRLKDIGAVQSRKLSPA